MYPDLSYLLADWFGTAADNGFSIIKMFGLLLVCAFLASAYILTLEMKRKEAEGLLHPMAVETKENQLSLGEILTNTFFVFVVAFKLPYIVAHFDEMKADPMATVFSSKGIWLSGLLFAGLFLLYMLYKKYKVENDAPLVTKMIRPHERVPDITMMAAVFGILGAKLFVVIESAEAFSHFLKNPIDSLFSGAGLAIYGGLIVAFIAVMIYIRKFNFKPLHIMDAAAPALIIGYAVGRLGCQLSGDGDWGIVNMLSQPSWWIFPDWMWAYDYPNTVVEYINPASGNHIEPIPDCSGYLTSEGTRPHYCGKLAKPVFPTPIYETFFGLGIFAILWSLRKRIKIPGVIFFVYCILNGFERFWIEKIRVNEKLDFFGLKATQAEIISTALFFIGIAGCWYLWSRNKKRAADDHYLKQQ